MTPHQHGVLLELSRDRAIDCGHFILAAEAIAQGACRGLGIERASLWVFDAGRRRLDCAALVSGGSIRSIEGMAVDRDACPRYFDLLAERLCLAVADVAAAPATADLLDVYARELNVVSVMHAPIRTRSEMVGIVCCEQVGTPREWSANDEGFVAALSELASRALAAEATQRAQDETILAHAAVDRRVIERTASLRAALEDLRRTQRQLVDAEKMAAIGSLVAGVAHEINTPVGVAITAASHLADAACVAERLYRAEKLDQAAFESFLETAVASAPIIVRNLERAAAQVQSFKRVAANQSDERLVSFDLAAALDDVVRSLAPESKRHRAECRLQAEGAIAMRGYPGAIDQVTTNLVVNALRHGIDGKPDGRIDVSARRDGEEHAMIEVRDNGRGIADEVRARLFEPFVTTRRDQGGTGLGLHICYNLVTQRLAGTIAAESSAQGGTIFRVRIPTHLVEAGESRSD